MITKTISKRMNRSLRDGHFVIGPVLFGTPFSDIAFIWLHVRICQDGGAVGFVDFTKLLFALSSLLHPFKRVKSIREHVFVILSQRKACTGRVWRRNNRKKNSTDNKMAAPEAYVHPVRNRLP